MLPFYSSFDLCRYLISQFVGICKELKDFWTLNVSQHYASKQKIDGKPSDLHSTDTSYKMNSTLP